MEIENVKMVGELFANSFGMEYFLSNKNLDYLVAVNWYTVECCGGGIKYE